MVGAVARRLALLPLTLLGLATVVFVLLHLLPGNPVEAMLAESGAPASTIAMAVKRYGLSEPLPVQYLYYLRSLLRGDLGESVTYGRPVARVMAEQLPSSLLLGSVAFGIALALGGGMGLLTARRPGTWLDELGRLFSVASVSVPTYWVGILAIMLFSARLRWLPSSGEGNWRHLVLPAATLGLATSGVVARVVRSAILEVTRQTYIEVAESKGLSERLLVGRHMLPAAAAPILAFLGLQMGFLLAGTAVTETVFSRRGVGRLLVEAVLSKDYSLIQGCILLAAATYAFANTTADLLGMALDPRLREG